MTSSGRLMAMGTLGLESGVSVVAGLLLGLEIDKRLGISPFGVLIGIVLGMITGVVNLMRALKRLNSAQIRE